MVDSEGYPLDPRPKIVRRTNVSLARVLPPAVDMDIEPPDATTADQDMRDLPADDAHPERVKRHSMGSVINVEDRVEHLSV